MNLLDRMISAIAPATALKRVQARKILASYDAATPSRLRRFSKETRSGEALARLQSPPIRTQARDLDRNHDLARGALTVMVNNIIGPSGIGIEPQPRSVSGEILDDLSQQLLFLWRDWCRAPEVTLSHSWPGTQRLMCRTWLRDGEAFAQLLEGAVVHLDHGTKVPLSLEMIEPDLVPTENELAFSDQNGGILRDAWGQPYAYRVTEVVRLDPRPVPDGERAEVLANIALLRRPSDMSREDYLDYWMLHHTAVAIRTQNTEAYVQNIVEEVLTDSSPEVAGIVEEHFPMVAMTDPHAFYGSGGDDAELTRRITELMASVARFGAADGLDLMPSSRYFWALTVVE